MCAAVIVDLIVHSKYVVGVETDGYLEDHALVVNGGKIVAVLPSSVATKEYAASETVNLGAHVLLPGFVNAHTHVGMTLLRGYSDDKCLSDWLSRDIWPTEAQFMSPEFVRDGAL